MSVLNTNQARVLAAIMELSDNLKIGAQFFFNGVVITMQSRLADAEYQVVVHRSADSYTEKFETVQTFKNFYNV